MRLLLPLTMLVLVGCQPGDSRGNGKSGAEEVKSVIEGGPTCSACTVDFQQVAVLGGSEDPASVREDAAGVSCLVGRLSTGEFLLGGPVGGGQILVYGPNGKFLRSIGKKGNGPGEFAGQVRLIVAPGDTIYALDEGNTRVQVMGPSGEHLRSFPLMGQFPSLALLGNGNLLFHRLPWQQEDPLFMLLTPTGEVLRRFGRTEMLEFDLDFRVVSPIGRGGFATGSIWTYEIRFWSAPDSLEMTLVRDVVWFPPGSQFPEGVYENVPPPPFLQDFWEDESGRLWTLSGVPDPSWTPGLEMRPRYEWFRKTFDTKVEVIDLERNGVIAEGAFGTRVARICNSRFLYTVIETASGDTRVQILEPRLVNATPKDS